LLYELRRYELFGHNKDALYERFATKTVALFERHGFRQIGYFQTVIGPGPDLIYLLGWEDLNERQSAWAAFHTDPDWIATRADSTIEHGLLVANTTSQILKPLAFSQLQ